MSDSGLTVQPGRHKGYAHFSGTDILIRTLMEYRVCERSLQDFLTDHPDAPESLARALWVEERETLARLANWRLTVPQGDVAEADDVPTASDWWFAVSDEERDWWAGLSAEALRGFHDPEELYSAWRADAETPARKRHIEDLIVRVRRHLR